MGCWGCGDAGDVECSRFGMFRMLDDVDVGCSGCRMMRMWDVRDVECLGCGMFGIWGVACGKLIYKIPRYFSYILTNNKSLTTYESRNDKQI